MTHTPSPHARTDLDIASNSTAPVQAADASTPARGSLRMVGEAQSVEAAFAYLEQLQRAGMLREARIDSHEWVTQGPQMVVRFVLTAQWRPAS